MVEDVCKLCGLESNVKINKIIYCKGCFNKHLSHKITKNIGKLKMNSRIFVHFNGTVSSFAMMYFLSEYKNKKLYKFYVSEEEYFNHRDFFIKLNLDLNYIPNTRIIISSSSACDENIHCRESKKTDLSNELKSLNIEHNPVCDYSDNISSNYLPNEKISNSVFAKDNVSLVSDLMKCLENEFDAVIYGCSMDNMGKMFLRNVINGNGYSYYKEKKECNKDFEPFVYNINLQKSFEEIKFQEEKLFDFEKKFYNSMVENTFLDNLLIINLFRGIKNKEIQFYISQIQDLYDVQFKSFSRDKVDKKLSEFISEVDSNNSLALFNIINTYKKI